MFYFAAFLAATLLSATYLLMLASKYQTTISAGWFGCLAMLAGALLSPGYGYTDLGHIAAVVFAVGVAIFSTASYQAIRNLRLRGSDQQIEMRAKTVGDIFAVAATRESLIELLNYALDRFLELLSLNSGAIHIYHKTGNTLVMGSCRGLAPTHAKRLEQIAPGQSAIGRAVQNKRVLIIRDLRVSPDYQFFGGSSEGYSFLAVAPIIVEDDCWGVITLLGRRKYYRGMLSIDQLEEFGYKLGQALLLGRENRQMAAAFGQLKSRMRFYDQIFGVLREDWLEQEGSPFDILSDYPQKLFASHRFAAFEISSNTCRCLYRSHAESYDQGAIDEISAAPLSKYFHEGYFTLDPAIISPLVPGMARELREVTAYGFGSDETSVGFIIIEEAPAAGAQKHQEDVRLMGNLFALAHVKAAYKHRPIRAITEPTRVDNLQTEQDSRRTAEEPAVAPQVDANGVIQSVLDDEKLDVVFTPGPLNLGKGFDYSGFRTTMQAVLKEAIGENRNRRLTLRSSSDNNSLSLTIGGEIGSAFPSADLARMARLNNIEIVRQSSSTSSSSGSLPLSGNVAVPRTALIVENRKIITELLTDLLTQLGYRHHVAPSGRDALNFLESSRARGERIDVAIIDMSLEDSPALELSRLTKELDSSIHTVIISSWGVNLFTSTLRDAGVDAVLHKPFRLEQLSRVLPKSTSYAAGDKT